MIKSQPVVSPKQVRESHSQVSMTKLQVKLTQSRANLNSIEKRPKKMKDLPILKTQEETFSDLKEFSLIASAEKHFKQREEQRG